MMKMRMLWIAVLVAMTVIAGCGGKKAADNPPPVEPQTSGGATETVQDILRGPRRPLPDRGHRVVTHHQSGARGHLGSTDVLVG